MQLPFLLPLTAGDGGDTIAEGGRREGARLKKLSRRHDVQIDVIDGDQVLRFGKGSSRSNRGATGYTATRTRAIYRWRTVAQSRARWNKHNPKRSDR